MTTVHNKFVLPPVFSPLTGLCTQILKFLNDNLFKVIKPVGALVEDFYNARASSMHACRRIIVIETEAL